MDQSGMESVELVKSATLSIAQLHNYGLVGTLLAILFIFAAFAIWYLAQHCEKRTDAAIDAYKSESQENRQVIQKNADVMQSMQLTMVEMKTLIATKLQQ